MKVILVNGSPNRNGSTNRALEEIKAEFDKTNIEAYIFWIGDRLSGCTGCNQCVKYGRCVFDDKVNEFGELAKDCSGVIFGSPVYYASANGSMVSFLDRVFRSFSKYLEYKPGATISVARRAGTLSTFDQLNKYLMINSMPVVSSQYWNGVHGANANDIESDLEGLQTMRTLARNMIWLLESIEAGKKAGVNLPKKEERVRTNFIR